ncbi:MAG: hypothetical protein NVV68_14800 [Dokdonella sp.]|nr:hypothetical protein [Dokdonella sp.]
MRLTAIACLSIAVSATNAFAGPCETNFSKKGTPFTGTVYRSSIALADLTVASAIEQLGAIAASDKLAVLSSDPEGGSLLVEQPETARNKPIPMILGATTEGGVTHLTMEVKLSAGAFAKADDVRREICTMLGKVQPGAAGAAAARRLAADTADAAPERLDAFIFSQQIARQAGENQSTINVRYKGRRYTLTGRADFIMEDGEGYNVGFSIPEMNERVIATGPLGAKFKVGVSCLMAKSQTAYTLSLREGDRIALTGTFARYDQFRHVVWLDGCVQAR